MNILFLDIHPFKRLHPKITMIVREQESFPLAFNNNGNTYFEIWFCDKIKSFSVLTLLLCHPLQGSIVCSGLKSDVWTLVSPTICCIIRFHSPTSRARCQTPECKGSPGEVAIQGPVFCPTKTGA